MDWLKFFETQLMCRTHRFILCPGAVCAGARPIEPSAV